MITVSLARMMYVVLVILCALGLWTSTAHAQVVVSDGTLTASFESLPLFSAPNQGNIAPGYAVEKDVVITNTGAVAESVILVTSNTFSTGLANRISVTVRDSITGDIYFDDTADILFLENLVGLGILGAGQSRTYEIDTTFIDSSDNSYQGTTMGFDVAFGFESGATVVPPNPGGGGGTQLPTPGNPNVPVGQVAGEAVSILPWAPAWVNDAFSWLQGITDTAQATTGSEAIDTTIENEEGESGDASPIGRVEGEATTTLAAIIADVLGDESCLTTWLLALAIISIVVTTIDDRWRRTGAHFIAFWRRHLLFVLGYSVAVLLAAWFGIISLVGIPLAIAWAVMQVVDYRAHIEYFETWTPAPRLVIYLLTSVLFGLLALIWVWPCVWWPFAIIAGASIVTYIFDR